LSFYPYDPSTKLLNVSRLSLMLGVYAKICRTDLILDYFGPS